MTCGACKQPAEPRGYDTVTGNCWFCITTLLSDEGMAQVRAQREDAAQEAAGNE